MKITVKCACGKMMDVFVRRKKFLREVLKAHNWKLEKRSTVRCSMCH